MVSIITLSYNTEKYLSECLYSLFAALNKDEFEVIVVDNASTDSSVKMVTQKYKQVTLITNTKNVGFGAGNNIGAKKAKGEFLLFLNSDTQIHKNVLPEMLAVFKKYNNVAAVTGLLRNIDGTYQRAYGKFHTLPILFQALFLGTENQHAVAKEQKASFVDWVTGAFMLVKRDAYEQVHGFDEGYFMYIEDMDLCYRLRKAGYRSYFLPSVEVMHVGQGSSNREFAIVQIYKGLIYFYKHHKPNWQYQIVKLMLYTKALLLVLLGTVTHNSYLRNTYRKALQF